MNIFMILIIILYVILGMGSTVILTGYMAVVIVQKIYRKVKYHASLYD